MKNLIEYSPMACWLHRWRIGRCLDSGLSIPGATSAHITRCGECAAHLRAQRNLSASLSLPPALKSPSPAGFVNRVMREIESPIRQKRATNGFNWRPVLACASVAAMGVALLIYPRVPNEPANVAATPNPSETRAGEELLARGIDAARLERLASMQQRLQNPLQKELTFVVQDTRDAVKALKATFVPSSFVASNGR